MNQSFKKKYNYLKYLLYIIPAFATWFIFALYPNLQIFYLAFVKWNGFSGPKVFVGFDNFQNVLFDPTFLPALKNAVIYMFALLIIQNVAAMFLALLLKRNSRGNSFFRTLFFSPLILSTAIVAMIWGFMYDPNIGVINTLLDTMGLSALKMNWLGVIGVSVICVVFVHIWHNMGYPITILTAGLQTIPDSLYEAAAVEGANKTTIFTKITLPLIMPTFLRVNLLTIIGGVMAFDYAFALGGGGRGTSVASEFETLSVFMYREMGSKQNVGLASSVGVMLALFVFVVFIAQFIATKKIEDSYN